MSSWIDVSMAEARMFIADDRRLALSRAWLETPCWLCRKGLLRKNSVQCRYCQVMQLNNPNLHYFYVQTIINVCKILQSCHKLAQK